MKYTDLELLESARQYQTPSEWAKKDPKKYSAAWYRDLLEICTEHMKNGRLTSNPSSIPDEELIANAAKFKSRQEWRNACKGKSPNLAREAIRRGLFDRCCQHMTDLRGSNPPPPPWKYTDEELIEAAKQFKHKKDWIRTNRNQYQAAAGRPEVFKRATAHMVPATTYFNCHRIIYACEFPDRHAYVGLTRHLEIRKMQHQEDEVSPVFRHARETGLAWEFKVLVTDIPDATRTQELEDEWLRRYQEGWTVLNTAKAGSLGWSLTSAWTKDRVLENASLYETRDRKSVV